MSQKTHIRKYRPKVAIVTLATTLTLMCFISQTAFAEEEPDQGTTIEIVADAFEEVSAKSDDSGEEVTVTNVPENTNADTTETTSKKTKKKSSDETETTVTAKKSKKSATVEEGTEENPAETTTKKSKKAAATDATDFTDTTETTATPVVTVAPTVETTVVTTTAPPVTTTTAVSTETTTEVATTENIDEATSSVTTEVAQVDRQYAEAMNEAIETTSHNSLTPEAIPGVLTNVKADDNKDDLSLIKGCAAFSAVLSLISFTLSVANVASREQRQELIAREKHLYKTANAFYRNLLKIERAYSEGGECPPEIKQAVATALAEFADEESDEKIDKNE